MHALSRLPFTAVRWGLRWASLALLAAWPALSPAQSTTPAVSPLVAFSGSQASAAPVRGPDGALYGTSVLVNIVTGGLIYRLAADGSSIRTLYQLRISDAYSPIAGVIVGSDGLLYGATTQGAADQANTTGTVYRLATDGSGFTVLHRFQTYSTSNSLGSPINSDGASPEAELIEGSDGFLYGTARAGGPNGTGTVFKVARDGSGFAVLHSFGAITSETSAAIPTNGDGMSPTGPLVTFADGYFYGTTSAGGANGSGTVFRVSFDGGDFAVMQTFPALTTDSSTGQTSNSDGASPFAGLTDGGDGRLYGVAGLGGASGNGTIFALDPVSGVFSVMHDFDGNNGSRPTGELLLGQDGKLYGTTASGGTNTNGNPTLAGTIFSIARDGTGFARIYSFQGNEGANPSGRMLQLDANTFIGLAQGGGKCGQGAVFQLSLTGATAKGVTNCGRRKKSGGGVVAPALLLLLGVAGIARRFAAR